MYPLPCRSRKFAKVLDGEADEKALTLIEKTSKSIMQTADCAIGFEDGRISYESVKAFRDEYESHLKNNRCVSHFENPVPCVANCPAHVDIPGYIGLVNEGNYDDAIRLIRKDNPFPSACALICEHPCEFHCRRGMIDSSVNIRGLKRMAVDNSANVPVPANAEKTGKKVAVIGGGQPIHDGMELAGERGQILYGLDSSRKLRYSHENPEVIALYKEFLGEPLGHKSHELLHTDFKEWNL